MIHITMDDLVDALQARAAICGDITGRGRILGDNDVPALERILRGAVPRAFHSLGLTWQATEGGWDVDMDARCGTALETYVLDYVTRRDDTPPAVLGQIPRLVGEGT